MAIGDAIGAQTLDAPDPARVPLVTPLQWTDQTQQLVFTARGLTQTLHWAYDRRVVGRSVAAELIRWYHDPTTATRRPGRTSLAAAVRLLQGTDWEHSGNPESDGADPLPRAVAVGLAFPPDEVVDPARTVTTITHAHPTAVQGAVLLAHLVSALARGNALDPHLVAQAAVFAEEAEPRGTAVRSLRVALELSANQDPSSVLRVDPRMVPEGDCGQRCGSAIGLAVLLALASDDPPHWRNLETAVAAAARIPHGSEVVAALTGALLGVAWGAGALPAHLVESVEERDELIGLARGLHLVAQGLGALAEQRGDSVEPGGWMAPTPESASERWARPAAHGTDLEWALIHDLDETIEREDPPEEPADEEPGGIEWITVGGEDLLEMEAIDADLLANVRRRW